MDPLGSMASGSAFPQGVGSQARRFWMFTVGALQARRLQAASGMWRIRQGDS